MMIVIILAIVFTMTMRHGDEGMRDSIQKKVLIMEMIQVSA